MTERISATLMKIVKNWLLDPKNITNFNADKSELELMILFWILAAGKNGVTAAKCLNKLLIYWENEINSSLNLTPFEIINFIIKEHDLSLEMKRFGIGCYNYKSKAFKELISSNIDLKRCDVDDLERIAGIGNKTSRCFLLHSRPNQAYAGLDRHVLRYMRDLGYDVPDSTPTGKKYKKIEQEFIKIANSLGKSPSELDLEVWNKYRNSQSEIGSI